LVRDENSERINLGETEIWDPVGGVPGRKRDRKNGPGGKPVIKTSQGKYTEKNAKRGRDENGGDS